MIFELFFRKSVEKIQVSLRSKKNNGYFTRRRFRICDNMSLTSKESFGETHTHLMFSYVFPRIVSFMRHMKNVVESERSQMAIWLRKHTPAPVNPHPRAHTHTRTRTHSQKYVRLIAFPRQQWCRERVLVLCCMYMPLLFIQGGSNMTRTNCDLFTHNQYRSYLNHLVFCFLLRLFSCLLSNFL